MPCLLARSPAASSSSPSRAPDRAGLVHAVTSYLVRHSGNILESQQFDDRLQDRFFMRVHFDVSHPGVSLEQLRLGFGPVAEAYRITWQLHDASTPRPAP